MDIECRQDLEQCLVNYNISPGDCGYATRVAEGQVSFCRMYTPAVLTGLNLLATGVKQMNPMLRCPIWLLPDCEVHESLRDYISASGTTCIKVTTLSGERASAATFSTPGTCSA